MKYQRVILVFLAVLAAVFFSTQVYSQMQLEGKIVSVDLKNSTIIVYNPLGELKVQVLPDAAITKNNSKLALNDLKEGDLIMVQLEPRKSDAEGFKTRKIVVETQESKPKINIDSATLNNQAEALIKEGRLKEAAEYIIESLKIDPSNKKTLIILARIYELSDLPEKEEKTWQALVQLDNNSVETRTMLATFYLKQGNYAKAKDILDGILNERPDYLTAKFQLARCLAAMGKLGEAETHLRELLKAAPNDSAVARDLVIVLQKENRLEDALSLSKEFAAKNPKNAENWFLLGTCQEELGRFKEAQSSYEQAVALNPKHARSLNNLGVLAAKKDNAADAIKYYRMAVDADPSYADAKYNLGRALIITKTDYKGGVRLLVSVASGKGEAAEKAQKFIHDLEVINSGGDPGWK